MKLFLRSMCLLLLIGTPAQLVRAADGSSGCGPGWYIFKENSLLSSSLRASTNGILWPTSTIGMTLGTSNCAKHSIVDRQKAALHFATMAYEELRIQMARGSGNHLNAFAAALGCDWRAQTQLNAALQKGYDQIFPEVGGTPAELVGGVTEELSHHPEIAALCNAGVS